MAAVAGNSEGTTEPAQSSILSISALTAAAFGLTVGVFYPGVMSEDARYIYQDIATGFRGDWQSPVMTVLWSIIDPVAPGAGSMFLLTVTVYWLAFGLLAFKLAQRSLRLALALLVLALSPPAFLFLSMIWRDVLFAGAWLLAAALCFAFATKQDRSPRLIQAVALALLAFGFLLRPNALPAAPVLAAYIAWPSQFSLKWAIALFVPAAVGLLALLYFVYYVALGAQRQHIVQTIMVFDLGGISHFARENQFPVSWTDSETALLTTTCYQPVDWTGYWNHGPCFFVMRRLEDEKLFGSRAMVEAWIRAMVSHPAAYLQHRAAFVWTFLAGANSTLWTGDAEDASKAVFAGNPAVAALRAMHDALRSTPLFLPGSWLLGCMAVTVLAWRRRKTPSGAFAMGVCGSASVYVLSFLAVGVTADFRYVYWAVLASIAGSLVLALRSGGVGAR